MKATKQPLSAFKGEKRGLGCWLADRHFGFKRDAVQAVRRVLHTATPGVFLVGDDFALVSAALAMHPHATTIRGCGVEGILVRWGDYRGWAQRQFVVRRLDGTEQRFSYLIALGRKPRSGLEDATRDAVSASIVAYKSARYFDADPIPCDLTGQPVYYCDAHVDHAPPWNFACILRAYVSLYGEPELGREGDCAVFRHREEAQRFRAFHDERATLRILAPAVNIRLGDRGLP